MVAAARTLSDGLPSFPGPYEKQLANRGENDVWRALGAAAAAPRATAGTDAGAVDQAQAQHNRVLEVLWGVLPAGLVGLSTRDWVSNAAAEGRVDSLEVRCCGVEETTRKSIFQCVFSKTMNFGRRCCFWTLSVSSSSCQSSQLLLVSSPM